MALVKRIKHGKRFTLRSSVDSKPKFLIKPLKRRGSKNGSRNNEWDLVIEECVDQSKKPA
jgi:hypothetical protein